MKPSIWRLFSLLMIGSMVLSLAGVTAIPQPAAAAPLTEEIVLPQSGADTSKTAQMESSIAGGQFSSTAGNLVMYEVAGATGPATYIVQLEAAPLASYRGDVAGLTATSPVVTGEQKLNVDSAASRTYRAYLAEERASFLQQVEQNVSRDVKVLYTYDVAYNGVAVELTPEEAAQVAQMPGVRRVTRNFERYIQTDTTPEFLNAVGIWDGANTGSLPGTMGEGIVVGIIDTGINMANPSFAATDGDGYTHTNPLGAGVYTGWCNPGHLKYDPALVCNDKLIGVYSYPGAEDNPIDDHSHGSHTASTTAGNVVYNVEYEGYTFAKISGMAPRANIISYDVCYPTPTSASCDLDAILAAINDAVADGVDVINYSIGGGPTSPWGDVDSEAYLNARDAGVFVATSAGNSGPGAGTVGSPGNAPWIMTVGNSTIGRVIANVFDVTGPGVVPAALQDIAAVYGPDGPAITADIEADIIYAGDVDSANILGCDPFPANSFTDSIALIQRGVCSFAIKVGNAATAGATAVVVFNNAGGPPIVMGALAGTTIPAVFISQDDGIAVRNWIQAETDPTARISADLGRVVNNDWADIMAAGSSRGPNVNSDWIKPDIAAPGTNIFAAYAGDADSFGMMSGTSMASPHVAGAGALLSALYPDWTPAEIQSALMMVSAPGLLKEDGTTPADPFDVGAGRLDLTNAALVGLVLDETTANFVAANPALGGDPTTLNLASLADQNCVGSCSWTRTFRSVLATDVTYNAWADAPAGMDVTVDPATFTVAAGATQMLTITADADLDVLPSGEWAFARLYIQEATDPAPVDTLLDEAFTDATFLPTGWASYKLQGGGTQVWQRVTTTYNSAPASAFRRWGGSADGYQDDWLVTPPLALEVGTRLGFYDRGEYMASDYDYSGVWISTGSCDPADGEFVELREIDDSLETTWRQVPSIDLSAYAGETACLAFRYGGDFAHSWWIDDVLVEVYETTDATLHHLPITVRAVTASAILDLDPTELEATQPPNTVTEATLVIGNEGGLPLDWEFGATGAGMIWDQPRVGTSGRLNNFSNADNTGIYQSSAFQLFTDVEIETIFMEGFALGTTLANATGLNWYIYADGDGSPAGNPEDGLDLHTWSYTATVGSPGVSIADDNMALDLVAAGEPPISLIPGTYWLLAYPDLPVVTLGPNVLYAWFHSGTGIGQQIGPEELLGWPTTWTSVPEGRAFSLAGQINCAPLEDIAWLTLDPTSGQVDPESAQDVAVTFDSTGLTPDEYTSALCITTNDPENELVVIPVTLIVEMTAEIVIPQTELSTVQPQDTVVTDTLTISNTGIADLEWEIEEQDTSAGLLSAHVLYDQTGNTTTNGVLAIYDLDEEPDWVVQAADDFVVPAGETWSIETVFAGGFYGGYVNPPQGVNVFFYADDNGLPGAELYAYPSLTPTTDDAGDLTLDLPTPAELTEGTYWVSVQPQMDYFGDGRWLWLTESVQTNSEFAWRNPSDGYGSGCTDWGSSSDCGFDNPDLTFQLLGERSGPCVDLSEVSWLSTDPISGTTAPGGSDDVIVTFDATGLDAGEYSANLCVFSNDPFTPLVIVPVSMEVLQTYTLDVIVEPVGSGTVDVEPDEAFYLYGDVVTLTAEAELGWTFAGWSGDALGTDEMITVTIEADTVITATFIELPSELTISKSVTPDAELRPGDTVTYTITLVNSGEVEVTGVILTDVLPSAVEFGAFVENAGVAVETDGVITWSGDLAVAETLTIVFTATVSEEAETFQLTIVPNKVVFTSENAGSGEDTASFTIQPLRRIFLPLVMRVYTP